VRRLGAARRPAAPSSSVLGAALAERAASAEAPARRPEAARDAGVPLGAAAASTPVSTCPRAAAKASTGWTSPVAASKRQAADRRRARALQESPTSQRPLPSRRADQTALPGL
jgi:hypothetical protein